MVAFTAAAADADAEKDVSSAEVAFERSLFWCESAAEWQAGFVRAFISPEDLDLVVPNVDRELLGLTLGGRCRERNLEDAPVCRDVRRLGIEPVDFLDF